MNSPREEFLSRVRQAVNAGNRPGLGQNVEPCDFRGISEANTNLVRHFRDQFAAVGGACHVASDGEACIQEVLSLVSSKSANRILLGGGKLIDELGLADRLKGSGAEVILVNELNPAACREPFFVADAGISCVHCLVAETGSVVLHSAPGQPRSLSLLPPVHIAVAQRNQIVGDLFDLFPSSSDPSEQILPSCITFITGPSKTGDIELKLVTGVHGPGEVHVILLES